MSTKITTAFSLVPQDVNEITGVGRAELQAYIGDRYANIPINDLANYLYVCYIRNLNPLLKHIYIVEYGGKNALVTSIDAFRLIAQRTGQYAGKKAPLYLKESGKWEDFVLEGEKILASRITVLKQMQGGLIVETTCDAYMKEYNKGINQWKWMPLHMLAKVAESLALRTAFPDELAGLYTAEEVEGSAEEVKTVDYQEKAREFIDSIAKIIPCKYWGDELKQRECHSEKDLKSIKQIAYGLCYEITYSECKDEKKKEALKDWYKNNDTYSIKNMEVVTTRYIAYSQKPANVLVYDMEKVKAIVDTLEGMENQAERIEFVKGIDPHYKAHPDVKECLSKYSLGE